MTGGLFFEIRRRIPTWGPDRVVGSLSRSQASFLINCKNSLLQKPEPLKSADLLMGSRTIIRMLFWEQTQKQGVKRMEYFNSIWQRGTEVPTHRRDRFYHQDHNTGGRLAKKLPSITITPATFPRGDSVSTPLFPRGRLSICACKTPRVHPRLL